MKAKNLGVFFRILTLALVAILLYINNKRTQKIKEKLKSITFSEFDLFFEKLIQHQLKTNYVGLSTAPLKQLYFVNYKNKVNIEFEAIEKEQINIAKQLIEFAKQHKIKIVITTYHNKTTYDKNLDAPVFQLITNLNSAKASRFAQKIFTTIFACDENTVFHLIS